jgi:urease accessory protein
MMPMSALLLLLLDSRAPAGAHSHSGGMEAAVTAGFAADIAGVERFCRFRLRTSGRVAAAFSAVACQLWLGGEALPGRWAELDAEYSARLPGEATRAASRQLGSGLRRLVSALAPDADFGPPWQRIERPAPHHPLVLGVAVAVAGGDARLAALAAALSSCVAPASAAVRLLGLDPYAVQAVLARLSADIDAVGRAAALAEPATLADLPALAAPSLDLLADVHARSEVRLFAS